MRRRPRSFHTHLPPHLHQLSRYELRRKGCQKRRTRQLSHREIRPETGTKCVSPRTATLKQTCDETTEPDKTAPSHS
ncbi:hypothetical protein MRX96_042174 [Rhipicephalus microplus]